MGSYASKQIVYSKPINPEESDKQKQIFRRPEFVKQSLTSYSNPKLRTMQNIFLLNAQKNYSQQKLIGTKDVKSNRYFWKTYADCLKFATFIGSGIINMQLQINQKETVRQRNLDLIGIFSISREECLLMEYACYLYNLTTVIIDENAQQNALQHILEQTNIESIFCSEQQAQTILNCQNTHKLKNLILFSLQNQQIIENLQECKFNIFTLKQIINSGKKVNIAYKQVQPDDILTIIYTPGTTGKSKGVMISHKNMVSTITTFENEGIKKDDIYASHNGFHLVFERQMQNTIMSYGGRIGFADNSKTINLQNDIKLLKPTILLSGPFHFEKFYSYVNRDINQLGSLKKMVAKKALDDKLEKLKVTGEFETTMWDRLIFDKYIQSLGGKLRICGVGAAPISGEVVNFLKSIFCIPIAQGYGLVETCGVCFSSYSNDPLVDHLGGIRGNFEFKIQTLPQEYNNQNLLQLNQQQNQQVNIGLMYIRGNSLFEGYFNDPEETVKVIDEEGWFNTGDIVVMCENGSIQFVDRLVNIFLNKNGNVIFPEKLESLLYKIQGIAQIFIYGDNSHSETVCVIVPDKNELINFANQINLKTDDLQKLCEEEQVKQYFLNKMQEQGTQVYGLQPYEIPAAIYFEINGFFYNDCVTNTYKIKRNNAKQFYKKNIQSMYQQLEVKSDQFKNLQDHTT